MKSGLFLTSELQDFCLFYFSKHGRTPIKHVFDECLFLFGGVRLEQGTNNYTGKPAITGGAAQGSPREK
jgi:hypothetical protein